MAARESAYTLGTIQSSTPLSFHFSFACTRFFIATSECIYYIEWFVRHEESKQKSDEKWRECGIRGGRLPTTSTVRKIVKWFMGNDWPVIQFWHKHHNLLVASKWLKHRCHRFKHHFNWLRAIYLCILHTHTHTRPQCGSNVCKSVLLNGLFDNCTSFDISQMLRGSSEYLISYLCPCPSLSRCNKHFH